MSYCQSVAFLFSRSSQESVNFIDSWFENLKEEDFKLRMAHERYKKYDSRANHRACGFTW